MLQGQSGAAFGEAFLRNLSDKLLPDELGSFILVLANSLQHDTLHQALKIPLNTTFQQLQDRRDAGCLGGSPDDLAVFDALRLQGLEPLTTWQRHLCGPWEFSINPIRKLRPQRQSVSPFSKLRQPFEAGQFHFDQAFLQPEVFAEEDWYGCGVRLLFHKFPFAPQQLLILPDAQFRLPQWLEREHHELAWSMTRALSDSIEGWGLAYNSLGAGASVNHLHFHSFVDPEPLPAEQSMWRHAGGPHPYPVNCRKFHNLNQSWQLIESLHATNQPYNLLYRKGYCLVFARRPQGDNAIRPWLRSAGWVEMAGAFHLNDADELAGYSPASISDDLRSTQV